MPSVAHVVSANTACAFGRNSSGVSIDVEKCVSSSRFVPASRANCAASRKSMWQFLCGKSHGTDDAKVVALGEMFALDPSIGELTKMPWGYQATRDKVDSTWVIRKQ